MDQNDDKVMIILFSYEASGEQWQKGYEERFIEYLEKLIRDLDKRVQRGKERLQRSADANTNVKRERMGRGGRV